MGINEYWEDTLIDSLNGEDLEKEYMILYDYEDEIVKQISSSTGFTYVDYAIIDGEECAIISQTDERVWLQEEWVEQIWDGHDWVDVE